VNIFHKKNIHVFMFSEQRRECTNGVCQKSRVVAGRRFQTEYHMYHRLDAIIGSCQIGGNHARVAMKHLDQQLLQFSFRWTILFTDELNLGNAKWSRLFLAPQHVVLELGFFKKAKEMRVANSLCGSDDFLRRVV
jgi:hypothetical protein